jgi:signal transduction histidine kinase
MQRSMIRLAFSILLSSLFLPFLSAFNHPQPSMGILDLRNEMINEKYVLKLNGEWEFYWKRIYRPHHFKLEKSPIPDGFFRVPSYWNELEVDGLKPEGKGYATYRLRILLPTSCNIPLGLDVKVMDSSYDLYVNGSFLGSNGVTGTSEQLSVPEYDPRIYRFMPRGDTLEILFNVSNYHHRRGGFWLPVEFGSFAKIQSAASIRWGRSISNVTILLAFCFFFMFFFILYPADKVSLFFAVALLGMGIRPLFNNQFLIHLFADPAWHWIIRMEYISTYTILTGGYLYVYSLFRSNYHRILAIAVATISAFLTVATLILPVSTFAYFVIPTYLLFFLFAVNSIACSGFNLFKNRRLLDLIYFGAFIVIVFAAIHDIVIASKNITGHGVYVLSEAIMLFVFIQSGLLIYKWIRSFREKEKLQENLSQLNRDLESIVNKRTKELNSQKNKAEEYSRQIQEQNKSLTDTINLKNRVFSVIAHDLRSPVVNIQYILNLLKEEEYRDKYESLAASCINYSQMVINLLENMLVWGRGQEDHIRYAPDYHDLASIILTNMSIYKDTADRKNISVNFTQIGGATAWIDKELIDIIIRNLLSNAIKYTNRGGRISILVKEKPKPENYISVRICDNGIGIPPERQKTILTSEEIDSTPGTDNEKGTGLGLKLAFELVKVNNGSIEIESKPGEGTCFTIGLPATNEEAE